MTLMFAWAESFNGDATAWDAPSATDMSHASHEATTFDQSLCWDVAAKDAKETKDTCNMFSGCIAHGCCENCDEDLFC